jgi:hypothetical protein
MNLATQPNLAPRCIAGRHAASAHQAHGNAATLGCPSEHTAHDRVPVRRHTAEASARDPPRLLSVNRSCKAHFENELRRRGRWRLDPDH